MGKRIKVDQSIHLKIEELSEAQLRQQIAQKPKRKQCTNKRKTSEIKCPKLREEVINFPQNINQTILEIDLAFYFSIMQKYSMTSLTLLDRTGSFVYYNGLAREHFEGSLNDLNRLCFFDLIPVFCRTKILQSIKVQFKQHIFAYCIYSKSSKRKFCKIAVEANAKILYYKYLKTMLSRIRPIRIKMTHQIIQGYWNSKYKNHQILDCFLLETKPFNQMLAFNEQELREDPVIIKFEKQNLQLLAKKKKQQQIKLE